MTSTTTSAKVRYNGDDSTIAFPTTFKFITNSHVTAILRDVSNVETTWVENTDYTLVGKGGVDGGTLTAIIAPATGEVLIIKLDVPFTQVKVLPLGGPFPSPQVEEMGDLAAMASSKNNENFERTLHVPESDSQNDTDLELPIDSVRALQFLAFDASGNPIAAAGTSANLGPVSTYIDTLLPAADALAARVTLVVAGLTDENTFIESQIWFKGSDLGDGDITGNKLTVGAGNEFDVAGTETIDEITTVGVGTLLLLHWDSARTLEHSAVNLILPGGEDIITVAGEMSLLQEYATGDFRMIHHMPGIPVRFQRSVDLSQKTTFFDDFIGTISTPISSTGGTGGDTEAATISAGAGGRVTMKSDIDLAVDTHAAVCSILTLDTLDWRADQGGLVLETRLQIDDVSEAVIFVGFTDTISTTVELPIFKTTGADTIDSDATNACGICYDIDGTTDEWFHGGVKAGTDTSAVHSGTAPSDNVYVTLRVEVSAAGAVEGFVDGVSIGTAKASAVTTTTPLTPAIVIGNRTANQVIVIVDYLHVQANR